MWDLVRIALEDIQNCFGITENLYEKYVEGEIKKDELLVPLIARRQNNFDWKVETGVAGGFYTLFMLAALKKNYPAKLVSLELSDEKDEVGKLVPEELRLPFDGISGWDLRMGASSLEYFKTLKSLGAGHKAQLYSHDSLHTMEFMTKELLEFKQSQSNHFIVFFDDQMSESFWDRCLKMKLFDKKGFDVKCVSGQESRLRGHLGGFIQYKKV